MHDAHLAYDLYLERAVYANRPRRESEHEYFQRMALEAEAARRLERREERIARIKNLFRAVLKKFQFKRTPNLEYLIGN